MSKYVVENKILIDTTPGAIITSAVLSPSYYRGDSLLMLNFVGGNFLELTGSSAVGFWSILIDKAVDVPLPAFPQLIPGFPVDVPEGFINPHVPYKPFPAEPVEIVEEEKAILKTGPNSGNALVITMTGRDNLPEISWRPKAGGDDIYVLGLNPKKIWYASLNGDMKQLNVDDRGYAWMFVKTAQAWLYLASDERK